MRIFDPRDYGANPNDNKDDTKAIQAALDAARDAGGGHVKLDSGTYTISGTGTASDGALRIYSNTEISGAGMGQTILKLADGWSSKITGLIRTPVNEVTTDVVIRDLTLDGNRNNSTADVDGIMTGVLPGKSQHDDRILIERVEIHDVSRIAFNPHEQTTNLTIRDSVAHHNSWDGFIADFVSNAVYENNVAYSNDRHGFNVVTHSHDVVLRNNISYDNAENGIVVQRGAGSQSVDGWQDMLNYNILLEGNKVYDNGSNGILFKQAENSQVIGNIIYGNAHDGIQLEGANEIIVDGNTIQSSNIFGIEIRPYTGSLGGPGNSYDNVIINNVITAVQKAFVETGSTTLHNSYAENLIGNLGVAVGKTATFLADSITFTYDKLEFKITLPTSYTNSDNTTPEPVPDPVPTPTPVVTKVNLSGDANNNILNGGAGDDTIKGRLGDDTLYGAAGADYLEGNEGNDKLHGGLGADTLKGGAGTDTFIFSSMNDSGDTILDFNFQEKIDLTDIVKNFYEFHRPSAFNDGFLRLTQNGADVNLYIDSDGASGPSTGTLFLTLKNISVSALKLENFILAENGLTKPTPPPTPPDTDVIAKPLSLSGTEGNDAIKGASNNDSINGKGGNDVLYGQAGDDKLWGNAGNDKLHGGEGSDWLKGGDGADLFVINAGSKGVDTIDDFRVSSHDKLIIGNLINFDPLTDTIANFVKATENAGNTIISIDADGTANGTNFVQVAVLTGAVGLGSATSLYNNDYIDVSSSAVS